MRPTGAGFLPVSAANGKLLSLGAAREKLILLGAARERLFPMGAARDRMAFASVSKGAGIVVSLLLHVTPFRIAAGT